MAPVMFEGKRLPRLRSGRLCLDFVNTVDNRFAPELDDYLTSYEVFVRWGQYVDVLTKPEADHLIQLAESQPDGADAVMNRMRLLRKAMDSVFAAAADQQPVDQTALDYLNAEFAHAMSHARVAAVEDGFVWGWNGVADHLDSVLWAVVRDAAELLISPDLERVRACRTEDCGWLFLDVSKNRSRRWCSMDGCGNRTKQRRHQVKARGEA